MAANINGASNASPGVYSDVESITNGVSVPSGNRTAVIIGEGNRSEVIVNSALGNGNDGIGFDGTTTGTPNGRVFLLGRGASVAPLIQNRTKIFRNGVQLSITEGAFSTTTPFDSAYQARVDINRGIVELQAASLVDQGGEYYRPGSGNTGNGTVGNLELIDPNAPSETWTARVTSVRRDGYGNPIDGYARFVVKGSVSGVLLDSNGNQITWQSDGQIRSNGILRFSISEGLTAFIEGDSFVIQTQGGSLKLGESLTANYISQFDINDPQFFTDINSLTSKHGLPSVQNRLSLGAQLSFANGTPGVFALQAAPAVPRRVSYTLVESANGEADIEDLSFTLPLGVMPDSDSNINFFVTDPITGVERQIIPNKFEFYNASITASPSTFVFGSAYSFSYTVVLAEAVRKQGSDGVLTVTGPTTATLSSASVTFNIDELSPTRSIVIENASNPLNNGDFTIDSVSMGVVTISSPGGFVTESSIQFKVVDTAESAAKILINEDLALSLGESLRVTIVDEKDADFFDPGWVSAYEAAERIDVDMVVPLPSQTISVIFQNGKVHVQKMSGIKNRRERMLFVGAISGLTPENVLGTEPAAVEDIGILEGIQGDDVQEILDGDVEDLSDYGVQDAFGDSFRTVYFYPDQIIVQAGTSRAVVDGFFMAAAAAGYFSGNSAIQEPITNKTLSGFSISRDKLFSPIIEDNLTSKGIALVRPVAGGGLVLFGKTTVASFLPEEEEISVVFIRDRIAKDMRLAFSPFIGKAETPTFQQTLYARATSFMQSLLSRRLITAYKDLVVVRDSVEPRQWNISVKVQPTFPVNWIYIRIGIGVI